MGELSFALSRAQRGNPIFIPSAAREPYFLSRAQRGNPTLTKRMSLAISPEEFKLQPRQGRMGIARHGPGASIASEGQVPGEARIFDQSPALAGRLKQAALGVQFSSNNHVLTEVEITFHDPQSNLDGSIRASELREFCYQFKTLLEQTAANWNIKATLPSSGLTRGYRVPSLRSGFHSTTFSFSPPDSPASSAALCGVLRGHARHALRCPPHAAA